MLGVARTLTFRTLVGTTLVALAVLLFAGLAGAQDYSEQPPSVEGVTVTAPEVGDPPAVEGASVSRDDDGALPVTGSDLTTLAVIGFGLVVVGGVAFTARRRAAA